MRSERTETASSRDWAARCEDLVKTYATKTGEVRALRGITARFPTATLFAVAGPSGSGKSSLLRLIAGIDRPTTGVVEVGAVNVGSATVRTLRRLRRETVGYVFQRPSDNFLPYLTLREHLEGDLRRGKPSPTMDPMDALDLLGMRHRADHQPWELSGGEQQRAAFARVLVRGADVIVADEPTSQLDTGSAQSVLAAMRELTSLGVTLVVATHDHAAMRAADARLDLEHGMTKHDRRPADPPTVGTAPRSGAWSSDPSKVWSPRRAGRHATEAPMPEPAEPATPPAAPRLHAVPTEASDRALDVEHLRKTYRRGDETVHAVDDVSLSVRPGEVVALVGRSGSGKTTLLDIVAGWEREDGGTIELGGVPSDPSARFPRWDELAMVPQKLGLMEELTVRENIEYPARLTGRLGELREAVDGLLERLGLDALQHRYPYETSVGEQQRTAVARALVLSPRVLLADEPTGHQDRGFKETVFAEIGRAAAAGTACLAATHDEAIESHVDRVIQMLDGRIESETTTAAGGRPAP